MFLSLSVLFGGQAVQQPTQDFGAIQAVADYRSTLASGITSSATSFTLVSTSTASGEYLTQGNTYGFKLGGREYVLGTLSSGKQITSVTRGISLITGTTTGGTAEAWGRGTTVEITDAPILLQISNKVSGREYFDTALTYAQRNTISSSSEQIPSASFVSGFANVASSSVYSMLTGSANTYSGATSTVTQGLYTTTAYKCDTNTNSLALCDKSYIDGVAVAGASNANTTVKGIVEQATASELSAGTATGGTGAVLFVDPSTLSQSGYASSTQVKGTITSSATTTLSGLPTRDTLDIYVYFATSTPISSVMRIMFNSDMGANYTYYGATPSGLWSSSNNGNFLPCISQPTGLSGGGNFCHIQVMNNVTSIPKFGHFIGMSNAVTGGGNGFTTGAFRWNNTSARITSITVASDSSSTTFNSGYIIVYGK